MKPLVWLVATTTILSAFALAANSPLLAWREPIYILAGFSGIAALALLLVQPLLIIGMAGPLGRRLHQTVGMALVVTVILHVAGLWITSPPDVIDALTFRSPTPFSAWGVIAMWAVFAAALLAVYRRRLRPRLWRLCHRAATAIAVIGTVVHAILIQGTMEPISKVILCGLTLLAALTAIASKRQKSAAWTRGR